jgi:uncharacterized glyoxalase superfamily protein PhnB
MELPARIGLITLACRDVERMTALFRNLGTNGVVIALYAARHYEPHFGPPTSEFRGQTLCVNLESFEECKSVYKTLRHIPDVELLEEPSEAFWGGGFSWRDPEGNIWDVAWAKGTTFDDRGGVSFP